MRRETSNVIVSVSLVFAIALTASSCRSGSESADSKTTPASTTSTTLAAAQRRKAAYVAAADGLCLTMNTRVDALGDPGSDPTKMAEVGSKAAVIITQTLEQLRALPPPAGDEAVLDAIYAKADTLAADYSDLAAAVRSRNWTELTLIAAKAEADLKAANAAAKKYGLTVCGS